MITSRAMDKAKMGKTRKKRKSMTNQNKTVQYKNNLIALRKKKEKRRLKYSEEKHTLVLPKAMGPKITQTFIDPRLN